MNEDTLINPRREKGEREIPDRGILCINPGDAAFLSKKVADQGGNRRFLYNSKLFISPAQTDNTGFFIAGPAVGSPMAVMTLEKLIALGAKKILVCGWCGSLCPNIHTGDVLLPIWSLSEEGTSQHYPLESRPESSERLRHKLHSAFHHKMLCHEGPVWTTDAVYRETKGKAALYRQKTILGVDMEFNALVTVARYREVELAAALLVSDQLWGEKWHPGFTGKDFRETSKRFLTILYELIGREQD